MLKKSAALIGAILMGVAPAIAGEVRLGVAKHDISDREGGFDIQAEYVFGKNVNETSRWWGIRPYLVAVTNTDGHINFGGAGLQPEIAISDNWFAEFQVGVVGHDGRIDLPPPDMPIERQHVLDTERTYGCEALFHLSPAVGKRFGERTSVAFYWEHLSHGQIFCSGKNEGLDNFGVRVGWQF